MIDHKLIVFSHLAKNPNTTKVAEDLLLSQPAVSKSIKELEKELSITLFDRVKGRLQLTEAGRYLLQETEYLIAKEREITFEIGRMRNTCEGILNIGASTTLSQYILPEVLAGFIKSVKDIKINVISGNTEQIESEILSGNLHVAFIEGTPNQPDIHYTPFIKDEIVLVCAASTEMEDTITKERLKQLNFVFREKGSGTYQVIKKNLGVAGFDITSLHEQLILGTTEGMKHYLMCTDCFAFVSIYGVREEIAAGKLKIIDVEGLSVERMFYSIHRQGQIDPYAEKFLNYMHSRR